MIKQPSTKIWRKLSRDQKKLWKILNASFNDEVFYPEQSPTFRMTRIEREAIAHNLALEAVWQFEDFKKEKERKAKHDEAACS